MERIAESVKFFLDYNQVQNFHKFMHAHTDILTNNIFATKD